MKIKYAFILEKFEKFMINRCYATTTINSYMKYVRDFLDYISKTPTDISRKETEEYLHNYNYTSRSQQNQVINAVKLFVDKALGINIDKLKVARPRKTKKLPVVLSTYEIDLLLNSFKNIKHKAIFATIYYFGLRISELPELRLYDFDNNTKLLHIKNSKGNKDRIIPINPKWIKIIREYYNKFKPVDLLFTGDHEKYSHSSIRNILTAAVNRCKITKKVSVHTLRHSYATHLLNSGNNLRQVQTILGHARVQTTEIYTHVTAESLQSINHV